MLPALAIKGDTPAAICCTCRDGLTQKLQRLSQSQQSIESVSSFCIFYSKDARGVVQIWEQEFYKAQPERKLALLYLANHILQEGRKKGMAFQEEFFKVLPKAISHMAKHSDDKAKRSLTRIVTVWEERRVFGTRHIKSFRDALGMPPSAAAAADAKPPAAGGGGSSSAGAAAPAAAAAAAAAAKLGPVGNALSLVLQAASSTAAKSQEFTSSWSQVSGALLATAAAATAAGQLVICCNVYQKQQRTPGFHRSEDSTRELMCFMVF
jgi:regulator of Ty1 transposition protein 103